MENEYLLKLFLSILIFAPGLVLLTVSLFFGLILLLEKIKVFDKIINTEKGKIKKEDAKNTQKYFDPGKF